MAESEAPSFDQEFLIVLACSNSFSVVQYSSYWIKKKIYQNVRIENKTLQENMVNLFIHVLDYK